MFFRVEVQLITFATKNVVEGLKTANLPYLTAESIPPTFWLVPPSPFSAGWLWGLLSRKFFFDFYFFRFSYSISTRILFFLFFQNIASTRQVFTRYSLSAFIFSRFILVWFWFRIYFISFTIFDSDYNFGFCVFRFYISTRFYSHQFRLVSVLSILRFNSSTLYLFNSSACYKQTSMLMWVCFMLVFSYFKAFWRVFVCFRCSLSSWDKIMRQKA